MLDATFLLRRRARRRLAALAAQDAAETQRRTLLRLVRRAARTRFGCDHGFAAIRSVEDYQAAVPIRRYDDFWRDYWQADFPRLADCTWPGRIPYFAMTSGTTTGRTKYIPLSRAGEASNRLGALDLLCHHVAQRPESRILGGRSFMLGGSTALTRLAPGVQAGDLSGIAAARVPWWARPRFFPPRSLALLPDWDEKVRRLAALAQGLDIRSISGTPSWLLLFFDRLAELRPERPRRLAAFFPELELIGHGGISLTPYRARFAAWLAGSHAETREVYAASEGFIAVADREPEAGLRLLLDGGLFCELVPTAELEAAAPTRHWIGTAERGVEYALLLSSCSGLWSYLIGDTVRLVALDPPRLVVTGRTAAYLSVVGEHLVTEQLEDAIAAAAAAIGRTVADYTVLGRPPEGAGRPGGHRWLVEFEGAPPSPEALAAFARALDERLRRLSRDYDDYRAEGYPLGPPALAAAPAGSFADWMRQRGRLGGQNKVPRVMTDAALFDSLLAAAAARGGEGGG